jgi:hypothetical protein
MAKFLSSHYVDLQRIGSSHKLSVKVNPVTVDPYPLDASFLPVNQSDELMLDLCSSRQSRKRSNTTGYEALMTAFNWP